MEDSVAGVLAIGLVPGEACQWLFKKKEVIMDY